MAAAASVDTLPFEEEAFVSLLGKLLGESQQLQNNPPELVPVEDRAGRHVLEVLQPLSEEAGGPLRVQHISFVEGRGNIIVEYAPPGAGNRVVSFVGAHLDVVTANPDSWSFPPFQLTREDDKLMGRGVTDCLGHVALLTELMRQLGLHKPSLKHSVLAVFIANEENATHTGIGVDELVKRGYLDKCKQGPLYWLDTADSQPCIGTGGIAAWQLTAHGKLFHSGLPHKAVNPLELVMDAVSELQSRVSAQAPPGPGRAWPRHQTMQDASLTQNRALQGRNRPPHSRHVPAMDHTVTRDFRHKTACAGPATPREPHQTPRPALSRPGHRQPHAWPRNRPLQQQRNRPPPPPPRGRQPPCHHHHHHHRSIITTRPPPASPTAGAAA